MDDSPLYSSCLWCLDITFMRSHLYDFIRPSSRKKDRPPWLKQAETDLCTCVDCMEEYHKLVQEAFESDSKFSDMKEQVYRADTNRLERYMKKVLQEHEDDLLRDDLDSIPMTQATAQLQGSLKVPVQEMLKYPRLLLSRSVCNQFVEVFNALTTVDESPEIEEKYPGIYLLLVFPDQKIRHWAVSTVKSLGTLDWDDYDELEDVVKWLITVITFNLFVDPVQDVGSAAWKDEECVQLPKHLYTYSSPKDYWLGICMLVTAMDAGCIRSRLMSNGASGHQQLIDAIINALAFQSDKNYAHHGRRKASCNTSKLTSDKANSTIFWPAMQCLVILLDRLQFRFWSCTTQSAENVAKAILGNPYYHLELKRWSLNGKDEEEINSSEFESEVSTNEVEDDSFSDSQVIYSWGNGKKLGPQGNKEPRPSQMAKQPSEICSSELFVSPGRNIQGKLRIAAFSWMFSFVHSLLDFGDMSDTVGIIFKAVHSIYQLALAGKRKFEFFHLTSNPGVKCILPTIPKLSESALCSESLLTISRLAELLFNNSTYAPLLKFQSQWLSDVTEAVHALMKSSISGQSSKDRMHQGLQAISSLPSALTHIMKLIRSMLKSPVAAELPMSNNILSAISTSPSVKASISKYQLQMCSAKQSLHGMATCDITLNLGVQGISEHLLLVLKKHQSEHSSSSPYLSLTETVSFPTPEPPSVENSKSTSDSSIAPPVVVETFSSAGGPLPSIHPLYKTAVDSDSLETDVTPDITSQEEDEAVLEGLGLSLQVQRRTNRAQDQLETSDSSDADICTTPLKRRPKQIQDQLEISDSSDSDICTTPLKRRPRPKGKMSSATLARKQLNLLSENTTDTDDFEPQPCKHASLSLTKQKQLLYRKRKSVKVSPKLKSAPQKSSSLAPDVTKTGNDVLTEHSLPIKPRGKNSKSKTNCFSSVQSELKSDSRKHKAKKQHLSSNKSKPPVQAVRGYGRCKTSASPRRERPRASSATHSSTRYKDDSGSSTEALSSDGEFETSLLPAARQPDKSQIPRKKGKETQPSSSKMQANEEIIVISSDDSNTTEPLSPSISTKPLPADSFVSSTRWCNQGEVHSTVSGLETVKHWLEASSHSPLQHTEDFHSHSKHDKSAKLSLPITELSDDQYVFKDLTAEAQDEHSDDRSDYSSGNSTSGALLHVAAVRYTDSKGTTSSIPMQSSVRNKACSTNTQTVHRAPLVPDDLNSSQHAVLQPMLELKPFSVDVYRIPAKGLKCGVDKLEESDAKEICHGQVAVDHHHSSRAGHVQKKASIDHTPVHISHPDSPLNEQVPPEKERNQGHQTTTASVEQPLLPLPYSSMPVNIETPTISEASTSNPPLHVTAVEAVTQATTQSIVEASLGDQIAEKLPSAIAKHNQVPHPKAISSLQTEETTEMSTVSEPIPLSEIPKDESVVLQQYTPDTSDKGKNSNTPSPSRIRHEPPHPRMSEIRKKTSTSIDLTSLSTSENISKHLSSKQTVSGSVTQASSSGLTTIWERGSGSFPCASKKRAEGSSQSDALHKCREHMPPPKNVKFDERPKSSETQLSLATFRQPATTTSLGSTNAKSSYVIGNITMQRPDFMKPSIPSVQKTTRTVLINIRPTIQRKMDDLYQVILAWDPARFLFPPETTDGRPIKPVLYQQSTAIPTVFKSYDEYCNIFTPLLHLELWENLYQEVQCKTQKPPACVAKVSSIASTEHRHFQMLKCTSVVSHHSARINAHPLQRDLVMIDFRDLLEFTYALPMGGGESNLNMRHRFAVVESLSRDAKMPEISESKTLDRSSNGGFEMTFLLKVLNLGVVSGHFIENREIEIEVITSLTSTLRQWNGLINLHHSQLVRDILHPRGGIYFGLIPSQHYAPHEDCLPYNRSQFKAIQTAVRTMSEPYTNPRICLLQGPPGTGKTHTISGMIQSFFETMNSQQSGRPVLPGQTASHVQPSKPHILVCSPSNAGIDEICRRLINEGLVIGTVQWTRKYGSRVSTEGRAGENQNPRTASKRSRTPGFSVVRVGLEQKIHPHVHCISLDEVARKKWTKDRNALQSADRVKKKIFDLQQDIDSLDKQRNVLRHSQSTSDVRNKMQKVETELNKQMDRIIQLKKQHKEEKFKQRNSQKEETSVRRKLLLNADIVCATLVGSGSSAFDCIKHNPLHFTCVIVDEASQCSEVDVLIPLHYFSSKLILVGDPLQLPATVKSNKALSLGFGKSLFERLFTHFMELNEQENPIQMLQVQYRMLPEICEFPSIHFYQGKLQTHCRDQASALAKFKPLQMFDVVQGQESQRSGGIYNMEESKLVVEICKELLHHGEVTFDGIGIITPYKLQEKQIKEVIYKKIQGSGTIDIGTVDSFQGREKDVIILSCVRARSQTGSIGFLSSRQRMNVALTRSKRGLYIVGHFDSLQINKDWKALIEHGKKNNVIVTLDTRTSYSTAARAVLRPQGMPMNASLPVSAETLHTTPPAPKPAAVTSHGSVREVSLHKRFAEHRDAESTSQAKRRKETTDSDRKRRHSLPAHPLHSSAAGVCRVPSTIPSPSKKAQSDARTELPLQSTSSKSVHSPPFHGSTDSHTKVSYSDISDTSDSDQPQSPKSARLDNREIDYAAVFPTPPRNHPPACGSSWRPHGGQRERFAHKSTGAIQKQRSKSVVIEESSSSPKKKRNPIFDKIKRL